MGPGLAVGDLNGDGHEDFFVGNASGSESKIFFQDFWEENYLFTRSNDKIP